MENANEKAKLESIIMKTEDAIDQMEVGSEERSRAIEQCTKLYKARDEHLAVVNESVKIAADSKKDDNQYKNQKRDRIAKIGISGLCLGTWIWMMIESIRSDRDPEYIESETTKNQKRSFPFNPFKIF